MHKKILLRTNILLCIILIIGFIAVSIIGYRSNTGALKKDLEHVASLTSESIYYQIDAFFAKPVNVSLTMANDSLLKRFLSEETQHIDDPSYLNQLQIYLHAYKEQCGYDSVFLVSTQTSRYYHFNGLDRILTQDNPENVWYYEFLEGGDEYSLNVDNDEAAKDVITVFVNCKINDDSGNTLGVVGVGLRVENLQQLLKQYDEQYNIRAFLIDEDGVIQLSSEDTGNEGISLFDDASYAEARDDILENKGDRRTFWQQRGQHEQFVASQYIAALKWHLVIENNTERMKLQFERQFIMGCAVTSLIIILVLLIINRIIFNYNERLVKLTLSQEMEYQNLLQKATEGLYENVFEFDITHDRAGGESTRQYFERLGMRGDTPYHEALKVIADKQIKDEYVDGYLSTFCPEHVLHVYQNGRAELYYDFMITDDGTNYRWMRIRARIFYWDSDQSVRMITYRQDMTAEKEHETKILRMAQSDPLTGLLNKNATRDRIDQILKMRDEGQIHALLMADIDHFKNVNDNYGHAAGDRVIQKFAERLKNQFRSTDICGRVGGDEFIVFLTDIPSREWLEKELECLVAGLREEILLTGMVCSVSASIGAAVCPDAGEDFDTLYRSADAGLYKSKERGRDCFTVFHPEDQSPPLPS